MTLKRRITLIALGGLMAASTGIGFVYLQVNQQVTLISLGVLIVSGLAFATLFTQGRRNGEHVDFTAVPNWRKFLVGMTFAVAPVVLAGSLVFGAFALRDGMPWFSLAMLVLAVISGVALRLVWRPFERYFPR